MELLLAIIPQKKTVSQQSALGSPSNLRSPRRRQWYRRRQLWNWLSQNGYGIIYLWVYILRLRPCRRPLWQSQASWLLAWRLGNILIGSLACWVLLSVFCFASTVCWSVCWFIGFWMLVSMLFFWYLQLPRYSPWVAHCFKTLGSDRFDGLLVW